MSEKLKWLISNTIGIVIVASVMALGFVNTKWFIIFSTLLLTWVVIGGISFFIKHVVLDNDLRLFK